MRVKVKICGIRSIDSAKTAVDAGADFLGFNFIASSKRAIKPEPAKEIIAMVRNNAKIVGIFQNNDLKYVNHIAEFLQLDFVQLHGEEDNEYLSQVNSSIIKRLNNPGDYNKAVTYYLLDRVIQGEGDMVNLDKAKQIASQVPVFFAGGLTPENVQYIVKTVKPFGVDVAGGIETNGREDLEKIKRFIQNAKS